MCQKWMKWIPVKKKQKTQQHSYEVICDDSSREMFLTRVEVEAEQKQTKIHLRNILIE